MDTMSMVTVDGTLASVNVLNDTCEIQTADGTILACSFPEASAHGLVVTNDDRPTHSADCSGGYKCPAAWIFYKYPRYL